MFDGLESMPVTVRVLLEAKAHIEKYGWAQDTNIAHDGRRCIIGAVQTAQGAFWGGSSAYDAIARAIGTPEIAVWNDRAGRTKADVLEAFDRAVANELKIARS
jgi:hypothetical protein